MIYDLNCQHRGPQVGEVDCGCCGKNFSYQCLHPDRQRELCVLRLGERRRPALKLHYAECSGCELRESEPTPVDMRRDARKVADADRRVVPISARPGDVHRARQLAGGRCRD